jgi:hypothetical protein
MSLLAKSAFVACGAALAVACSINDDLFLTECNENPWECPSGEACWLGTATSFGCFPAGGAFVGVPCQATLGTPTCQAGLACVEGTCEPCCSFADSSHACSSRTGCKTISFGGTLVNECVPVDTADGGHD